MDDRFIPVDADHLEEVKPLLRKSLGEDRVFTPLYEASTREEMLEAMNELVSSLLVVRRGRLTAAHEEAPEALLVERLGTEWAGERFALLREASLIERRRRVYWLTPKGEALLQRLGGRSPLDPQDVARQEAVAQEVEALLAPLEERVDIMPLVELDGTMEETVALQAREPGGEDEVPALAEAMRLVLAAGGFRLTFFPGGEYLVRQVIVEREEGKAPNTSLSVDALAKRLTGRA